MATLESSITIQSDISNIDLVFEWAEKEIFAYIKEKNIIDNLKLCLQEAVVNSIVHGNKSDKKKSVIISYKIYECKLSLKVEDEGKGIPELIREKEFKNQSDDNLFEESGRGMMLIKHFCQNVKFGKNYLQMSMKICETPFDKLKTISTGISVLYVEDNDILREKMLKMFKMFFTDIDAAINGKNGLELYMNKKYDLVISDIVMPELNGLELVKAIKNVSKSQRIIFLSAYTEIKYLIEAIELGVDGFVFKPIQYEKLYDILLKVVKQINQTKENLTYKNDLEILVQERTKELESTNKELVEMINEVKKSNELKEEMKIAQRVQENFLPKKLLDSAQIKSASFFKSATYVGGDYYDMFYSNDNNLNIIIADVSGHGIAPSITMSTFRGICRALLKTTVNLQNQVEHINDMLCEDSKTNDFFITAVFIKYYEKEQKIEYISAGHNEILHYNTKKDAIDIIKSTSLPLGIFEGTEYKSVDKEITKNDTLILYTDGLTEAQNENGIMYSFEKLYDTVLLNRKSMPNEILNEIENSLKDFIQKHPMNDDTTILVSKFI